MVAVVVEFKDGRKTTWAENVAIEDVKGSKVDAFDYFTHMGEAVKDVYYI